MKKEEDEGGEKGCSFFHPPEKLLQKKKRKKKTLDLADQTGAKGNLNKDDDKTRLRVFYQLGLSWWCVWGRRGVRVG